MDENLENIEDEEDDLHEAMITALDEVKRAINKSSEGEEEKEKLKRKSSSTRAR